MGQNRGQIESQPGVLPTELRLQIMLSTELGLGGCEDGRFRDLGLRHEFKPITGGKQRCSICGSVLSQEDIGV
jgi:hypothetical protein